MKQQDSNTNSPLPLYQILNEARTGGKWYEHGGMIKGTWETSEGKDGGYIAGMKLGTFAVHQANARYAALAVNNLHLLAEALQDLIDKAGETTRNIVAFEGAEILDASIDKAKQALSLIS